MMYRSTVLLAFFVCVVLGFNWTHAEKDDEIIDKEAYLLCTKCKDGIDVVRNPNVTLAKWIHYLVVNLSFDGDLNNSKEQMALRNYVGRDCAICEVGYTVCKSTNVPNYQACSNRTATFTIRETLEKSNRTATEKKIITKNFTDTFPHTIDIPIGGLKNLSRHARSPVTCSFPTSMNTAALTCKVYPSSISCVQRCAFGYTLQQGITQQMSCNFKQNKWIPTGFEECRPFVDCSLSLISGGASICTSMSLATGPECRVECYHYEDREEVPEKTYTCSIDGKWSPKLPFCVSAETGLMLVSPPKIKLHGALDRTHGASDRTHGSREKTHAAEQKIQDDTKH